MHPDQNRPTERGPRRFVDYLGGPWVWIVVGLLAVAALTVSWIVEPGTPVQIGSAETTTTPVPTQAPTTATTTTSTTLPASTPSTEGDTEAPEVSDLWTMPDEVGNDLASAKRAIVQLTGGTVDSSVAVSDASGRDRRQIIHENWKVCSQTPAPGSKFTPESGIEFAVVKNNETCPNESAIVDDASAVLPTGFATGLA